MNRKFRQRGLTLSGVIYACIVLGFIALMVMKLFPLYNEKTKVDLALEKVASQKESARMTKIEIVRSIYRQFQVSEVRRWNQAEFAKALKITNVKGKPGKVMKLAYEIRGPFFGDLEIVLNYDKTLVLGQPVTD